jgi:hypothetical protein
MAKQTARTNGHDVNPAIVEGAIKAANSEVPLLNASDLAYDDMIKRYASITSFGWWELGEAANVIKSRNLWEQYPAPEKQEPFHSFEDYVQRRAGHSRTAIYRALQLRTGLAGLSESDSRQMSQANAIHLLHLVKMLDEKKALDPKVIKAALTMQEKEFSEFCDDLLPGAAKEEKKENITFKGCDKSLVKVVDLAMQVSMWDAEVDDERDALERIVSYYLDGKCEHEGMLKLSNREAYHKNKGKKRTAA